MNKIYILVGSPGSGKTWVSQQLHTKYNVAEQDDFIGKDYVHHLLALAHAYRQPVLANTPFGLSKLMESLQNEGAEVEPVFIIESPLVLTQRYQQRENKPIPPGHITRQYTYLERARELRAFHGTAEEVLNYLKSK